MKKFILFILLFLSFYTILFAETEKELFDNGVLQLKQGHYQQAADEFSKLIQLAPDNADAYKNRGVVRMNQKKYDLAIKDFQTAKKIFPKLHGLYSNLGVAWFYKRDYNKAIKNYNAAIKTDPQNHVAYFNRALCFAELNKNKEAIDDLSKTLALTPDFYLAICYKADLLTQLGETDKAIETYKSAIQYTHATKKLNQLKQKINELENRKLYKKKPGPATVAEKGYALQAGAYLNSKNADIMKKKLSDYGFESRILVLVDKKQRPWYLVRSGIYLDKTKARKSKLSLDKELGIKSVIRPFGIW
ncbi:SPOR domain-containing protein [Desulfobacula sp.]